MRATSFAFPLPLPCLPQCRNPDHAIELQTAVGRRNGNCEHTRWKVSPRCCPCFYSAVLGENADKAQIKLIRIHRPCVNASCVDEIERLPGGNGKMKRCQQQSGKTEIRGALTQAETLTTKVQHGPAWGIGRTGTSATIRRKKKQKNAGEKNCTERDSNPD